MWVRVRTACRRQHCETFAKGANHSNNGLDILGQLRNSICRSFGRTPAAVPDMMEFVREGVFKLLFAYGGVEEDENSRISFHFEDKTVGPWLDDRIDLCAYSCLFGQVSQRQTRRAADVWVLP